jgi:lysophospholipase L1-like esterase
MNTLFKKEFPQLKILGLLSLAALTMMTSTAVQGADLVVKNGEQIAFMGDSITQAGARPNGYVRLVISGLKAAGVETTAIPAGISGHKSNQMLARLEKDVLSKKPAWMTLSCGVNDVWHGARGVNLEDYKVNITKIVEMCEAAKVKVVILTSTMIGEDEPNKNNQKLATYNEFLRTLAKEKNKGRLFTSDGVHMNPNGNRMMAAGVLKAFGLSDAQLEKARQAWSVKK